MANELATRDDHVRLTTHLQTCSLHDYDRMSKCSGRLRKGGSCSHKAIVPSIPGMMPTCKVHRDQMMILTWCRAPLSCGFECRRFYEWEPHGFQLCPDHLHLEKPCYFLKIPTEIRLSIYHYLLPNREIYATGSWYHPYKDGEGFFSERFFWNILFVNRQIHDEAIGVLYGTRLFNIEFNGLNLRMCNMPSEAPQQYRLPVSNNHAAQDCQMQLMCLAQQNKKRLMMARREHDRRNNQGSSSSAVRPPYNAPPMTMPSMSSCVPMNYNPLSMAVTASPTERLPISGPAEPTWVPPINPRHFNLIQSFRIHIIFAFPRMANTTMDEKAVETSLYEWTDHLHRLVGRLLLIQKPIVRLEVAIRFVTNPYGREKAFSFAQILLRPFQRLRNIVKPAVSSIITTDANHIETELLPTWNAAVADKKFAGYVEQWFRELSSDEMTFVDPPVFDAYWQLKSLLLSIKAHCHNQPRLEEFADLLHAARVVREDDNLPQFREIWDRVVNVWFDYLNYEKEFQSRVALSIDGIYDTVSSGSGKGRAW
jgi:hypothetical protein